MVYHAIIHFKEGWHSINCSLEDTCNSNLLNTNRYFCHPFIPLQALLINFLVLYTRYNMIQHLAISYNLKQWNKRLVDQITYSHNLTRAEYLSLRIEYLIIAKRLSIISYKNTNFGFIGGFLIAFAMPLVVAANIKLIWLCSKLCLGQSALHRIKTNPMMNAIK